jgi:hypothetical protein
MDCLQRTRCWEAHSGPSSARCHGSELPNTRSRQHQVEQNGKSDVCAPVRVHGGREARFPGQLAWPGQGEWSPSHEWRADEGQAASGGRSPLNRVSETTHMQRLAGSWAGTYECLEPEMKGSQRIGFTLEVSTAPSWRLHGEVWDDPITGMDGRGTISGWSWGRHIWFQKVMPYLQVMHDPKPIALDDYVQAHFGEHLAGDPDKHSISYRGVVAPNRQTVKGTWRIPHRRLSLASGRVIVVPLARGTWEMRRQ